jgi:hypothetical protein
MNPDVGRDLPLLGQLDHVNWRRIGLHDRHFNTASSYQIGVLRGRRIASRGIARACLAPMAFNFKPAASAIETLPDSRRRLRGPTLAFHLREDPRGGRP